MLSWQPTSKSNSDASPHSTVVQSIGRLHKINNDLYFCVNLSEPTTDDLEIRVITDEPLANEDVYINIESIEL